MTELLLSSSEVLQSTTGLREVTADDVLDTAQGGIPWLIDAGDPACFPGGSIVNGTVFRNLAGGPDSAFIVTGTGPTTAGGGVAFDTVDTSGTYLSIPASVAAAIVAANQRFMFSTYMRLPLEEDWHDQTGNQAIIINWAASTDFISQADILSFRLATSGGVKQMISNRQTAIGTSVQIAFSPVPASFFGAVAQIGYWRNAAETVFTVRTPGGRFTVTAAAGDANTVTGSASPENTAILSSLVGKIGVLPRWGSMSEQDLETRKFRFYRAFVELPAISERTPLAVLDADWDRNAARFS